MAKAKDAAARQEMVVQVPDLGLTDEQVVSLKKSFKNSLVSSMGEKMMARPRIIIVRIRIVSASKEL